jgi:hypothetical protein
MNVMRQTGETVTCNSIRLKQKHRLIVSEIRMLREETTGGCRKMHNEEFSSFVFHARYWGN